MTNQQDAGEEEWWMLPQRTISGELYNPPMFDVKYEREGREYFLARGLDEHHALWIIADHAAARRARKLEETLREIRTVAMANHEPLSAQIADAALLSPATGKEEAP